MIPHRLNLLSPKKRQYLKKMVTFQFIKTALEFTLIFLCIAGVTLLSGQLIIQDYLNRLTGHMASVSEHYSSLNQDIKKINNRLITLDKIQNEYQTNTKYLYAIAQALPNNISLSTLKLNAKSKQLEMSGQAQKREDLLKLKDNLEKTGLIEKIEIPPAQLTEKEDVQFALILKIKAL